MTGCSCMTGVPSLLSLLRPSPPPTGAQEEEEQHAQRRKPASFHAPLSSPDGNADMQSGSVSGRHPSHVNPTAAERCEGPRVTAWRARPS